MTIKANKGEWSEFYAFLKILQDRKLFAAKENLEIIPEKFFPVQKVFRSEKNQEQKIFDIRGEGILILDKEGNLIKKVLDAELPTKVLTIFNKIKAAKETTFEVEEAVGLMSDLLCTRIKAGNGKKADMEAEIFDRLADTVVPMGFSVKSTIGNPSTLLNSGKTTNFAFEVIGLDKSLIDRINSILTHSKIQDRVSSIIQNGGQFIFRGVLRDTFESNLRKIDTMFPLFLATMLLDFFLGKEKTVLELTKLLSANLELQEKYGLTYSDYEFKVKNFLHSAALGMVPSKIWDGSTKAHGGYIIVRYDGMVVCYNLYNRDEFLAYLFENTRFDTPSSKRHEFGKLYIKEGKIFFNLNLQIRFTS